MRIGADDFFHLTYCTNIHPGERWPQVMDNLQRHIPALKARLTPDEPFGIGLRLSDVAARELLEGDTLPRFRDWLGEQDCYVFTINGFPHGGFHGEAVKDRVYRPDWRSPERLDYTMRLSRILAALLPEGLDGGISTVPLSYKPWFSDTEARSEALKQSCRRLAALAGHLVRIREETGRFLHLDLEPEPDCLLENSDDVLDFYRNWLLPHGAPLLAETCGTARAAAEELLLDHLRLCYDTCHFAVAYEGSAQVLARFRADGIRIGKVQISAALRVPLAPNPEGRRAAADRLRAFADSVYLHQTVERHPNGRLHRYPDLTVALRRIMDTAACEWRIHFHVPVFIDTYGELRSTQPDIVAALSQVTEMRSCRHLEIETYTWDVLPTGMKAELLDSIEREYVWAMRHLPSSGREHRTVDDATPPPPLPAAPAG